jgi:hypothetical protein
MNFVVLGMCLLGDRSRKRGTWDWKIVWTSEGSERGLGTWTGRTRRTRSCPLNRGHRSRKFGTWTGRTWAATLGAVALLCDRSRRLGTWDWKKSHEPLHDRAITAIDRGSSERGLEERVCLGFQRRRKGDRSREFGTWTGRPLWRRLAFIARPRSIAEARNVDWKRCVPARCPLPLDQTELACRRGDRSRRLGTWTGRRR